MIDFNLLTVKRQQRCGAVIAILLLVNIFILRTIPIPAVQRTLIQLPEKLAMPYDVLLRSAGRPC